MAEPHFPPPQPEQLITTVQSVEYLRELRFRAAETATNKSAERMLRRLDLIGNNIEIALTEISDTSPQHDVGTLGSLDLLSFDAIGISPEDILSKTDVQSGETEDLLYRIEVEDGTIDVRRYSEGVTLEFAVSNRSNDFDNDEKKSQVIAEKIKTRVEHSPAHRAIHALAESGSISNGKIATTEPFDPFEDPLGTLVFMNKAGFLWDMGISRDMRNGMTAYDLIIRTFQKDGPCSVERHETEYGITLTTGKEVVCALELDKRSGLAKLAISKKPLMAYPERANQSPAESIPFIDTRAAAEIYDLLDRSGLMLHPKYEAEAVRIGAAKRFGSLYTQLSREIAKWVDRPERMRLDNVFVPYDPLIRASMGAEIYEGSAPQDYIYAARGLDETVRIDRLIEVEKRISGLDVSQKSEPTRVLLGMVQDCISRKRGETLQSELEVTKTEIQIEGGACFDVIAYYISSAEHGRALVTVDIDGVPMLEKTHGKHTFMLLRTTKFNGVGLPKGTLMQQGDDGGWAMLRLTPLCFDSPIDQQATGSELAKAAMNKKRAVDMIGGTALEHLAAFVVARQTP